MTLHHYTAASNLPKILEFGKIRFTRADHLDDPSEMQFVGGVLTPAHFFVSSWSAVSSEQSGQWHRYGDANRGVRISLPSDMFGSHNHEFEMTRHSARLNKTVGLGCRGVDALYSAADMFRPGCLLVPFDGDPAAYLGAPVEYVDNPAATIASNISVAGAEQTYYELARLLRIKQSCWSDQVEHRFTLLGMHAPDLNWLTHAFDYQSALLDQVEADALGGFPVRPADHRFVDIALRPDALNQMRVTLGCHITDDDRRAIQESVSAHAPGAVIVESSMIVRR